MHSYGVGPGRLPCTLSADSAHSIFPSATFLPIVTPRVTPRNPFNRGMTDVATSVHFQRETADPRRVIVCVGDCVI